MSPAPRLATSLPPQRSAKLQFKECCSSFLAMSTEGKAPACSPPALQPGEGLLTSDLRGERWIPHRGAEVGKERGERGERRGDRGRGVGREGERGGGAGKGRRERGERGGGR